MITYLLRHGQTNLSKKYVVNGEPSHPVRLDEEGKQSLSRVWSTLPLHSVETWLTSEFPRAQQTASLLMGVPTGELVVDARLNELDYGVFEGCPFLEYGAWLKGHGTCRRPPGSAESQQEGIQRMLTGVLACLENPGPRVIVGHGLLLSALLWDRGRSRNEAMPLFFPEAPYAEPLALSDDELPDCISALLNELGTDLHRDSADRGEPQASRSGDGPGVANVEHASPSHSLDQKDLPHA